MKVTKKKKKEGILELLNLRIQVWKFLKIQHQQDFEYLFGILSWKREFNSYYIFKISGLEKMRVSFFFPFFFVFNRQVRKLVV